MRLAVTVVTGVHALIDVDVAAQGLGGFLLAGEWAQVGLFSGKCVPAESCVDQSIGVARRNLWVSHVQSSMDIYFRTTTRNGTSMLSLSPQGTDLPLLAR